MERTILHSLWTFILGITLLRFAYNGKLEIDVSIVLATIGYELLSFSVIYFTYGITSYMVVMYKERMTRKLIWDAASGIIFDPETKEAMFDFKFYGVMGIFFDSETKDFLCICNSALGKYFDKSGNVITMNELDKEWQIRKRVRLVKTLNESKITNT
jgi:hypothetical protein